MSLKKMRNGADNVACLLIRFYVNTFWATNLKDVLGLGAYERLERATADRKNQINI